MAPTVIAEPAAGEILHNEKAVDHEAQVTKANHESTGAATIGDDKDHATSDDTDAATTAASEELKHTTLSDKVLSISQAKPEPSADTEDNEMGEQEQQPEPPSASTPENEANEKSDLRDELMAERIYSPKKKRGRDQEDDARDVEAAGDTDSSPDGAGGKRVARSGPEKKRPRDTSVDSPKTAAALKLGESKESKDAPSDNEKDQLAPTFGSAFRNNTTQITSASAFANSGFASLSSSSSSPFGTIGASKPSVFGGKSQASGFGASGNKSLSATTTTTAEAEVGKPTLGFGFGGGSTTSGFGGLGSGSGFGSALGNGFGGGFGPKLSSFAAPVKEVTTGGGKVKAFGAPESDEDDASGDDGSEGTPDSDDEEAGAKVAPDDKKKPKASKVEDGESGEATLLQVRAKLFALESKEAGWKERGVGTLKINVPEVCASFDEAGLAIPGSFDRSSLDTEEDESSVSRVPRLIMRQENTHRVVLNTAILSAMKFTDKPSQNAAQILFTAFEGETEAKPINMLLKLSENNAKLFKSEVESIQREMM